MITFLLKIMAPADSRRGEKLRHYVTRVRNKRAFTIASTRYNKNRQNYYDHAVTKTTSDQTRKISIVIPAYNTPKKYFEPLIASVFSQGYENWELVIVDASDNDKSSRYIKGRSESDTRIKYIKTKNEGIAINTNKGIANATGELIAFLDHDDTLDQDALTESAEMFSKNPSLGLIYSDEDKVSDNGEKYFEPHFKPDFSLDMLRNVNYITHFVVLKRSIATELKGIREGFDGAQDYDFLMRVVDTGVEIGHIPKVLYHWRQADGSTAADFSNKQHVTDAGCQALKDHYSRRGVKHVKVSAIENRPGFYKAEYKLDDTKRQIFINFSGIKLSRIEKDYILDCYRKNKDVIEHKIAVIEGAPDGKNSHSLIVNGTFIPATDTTDIASLFALANEAGIAGVSPKIVRNGRIFDLGIVKVGRNRKYLFRGVNPKQPMSFGSVEWVRNVDELTGNIGIYVNNDDLKNGDRFVVWSHSEFVAFATVQANGNTKTDQGLYNPNVSENTEIIEEYKDYLVDLIEVKK